MSTSDGGFELGLLPERKIDKRAIAASYSMVSLLLLLLICLSMVVPEKLTLKQYHVTEIIPLPAARPEPEPMKKPDLKAKLLPEPKLPVFEEPKLVVPPAIHREAAQPVEAPKVVVNQFATPQLKLPVSGARPQLVHTGDFGASTPTPTVNVAVDKVQTGGFGDPNGLPGTGKGGAKLYTASVGSFDMPAGQGQGNGTGGAKGIKGTVASADFGSGVASGGRGDGRSNGQGVSTGGFGSEQVVHNGPKVSGLNSGAPTNPVKITFKPNPVYTQEALNLKIEGEVLLDVTFNADGSLHVNRVVRGLGHGLDEAAIAAANKMKFEPALRNGQPVDSTAVVHVTFQMAY